MKKSTIGLVFSIIGIFMIGLSIGASLNSGENNLGLTFGGLFCVFIGFFILILNKKKKLNEKKQL
ncbi:MAG: hypothetical protein ABI295_10645 [Xanthomarina sp.]